MPRQHMQGSPFLICWLPSAWCKACLDLATCCMQASDINALFGFRLECIERMGDQQGLWAWQRINSLFNWLPLAALIEDRIVCMHGGEQCCSPGLIEVSLAHLVRCVAERLACLVPQSSFHPCVTGRRSNALSALGCPCLGSQRTALIARMGNSASALPCSMGAACVVAAENMMFMPM